MEIHIYVDSNKEKPNANINDLPKCPTRLMSNTYDGFVGYCDAHGIILNEDQAAVAKAVFNIPTAGGKTLLTALLYAYDPAGEFVLNDICSESGVAQNIR